FTYVPPGLTTLHSVKKWAVNVGPPALPYGDYIGKNVGNGPGGAGSTMTLTLTPGQTTPAGAVSLGGGTYTYNSSGTQPNAGGIRIVQSGACVDPILNSSFGACAGDPCDLTLTGQHHVNLPGFTSGTDLGDPYVSGTTTYSRSIPPPSSFTDLCGQTSPYTGT